MESIVEQIGNQLAYNNGKNKSEGVNWTIVNSFGQSRFSKNSYVFLVLVPIAAKFLQNIQSPVEILFGGKVHEIQLQLPFNWYVFYFGASLFSLASLIYVLYCPTLIKRFKDYGEFVKSGESDRYLDLMRERHLNESEKKLLPILGEPFLKEKEKVSKEIVEIGSIRAIMSQPASRPVTGCLLYTSPSPRDRG